MKRFLITVICILAFSVTNKANADVNYFSIQKGIPTLNGNIPTAEFTAYTSCDVFSMEVDGEKYYMLKGSAPYSYKNLVGCDGNYKSSMYSPLWDFDTNMDSKLTPQELKAANVRFVLYKNRQKLLVNSTSTDFNLDRISSITLANARISITLRGSGNFDVFVFQDKTDKLKKIIGKVNSIPKGSAQRMF